MNHRLLRLLSLFAVLALVFAACGGDDDDDTTAGGDTGTEDGDTGEGGGDPEPGPGFDGTTIRLGILTPLTGGVEIIGKPLTAGHEVWFDKINAEGGIAGKYQVELDIKDSQYRDEPTVQQYSAIKDDVVMFAQILGTPPTQAVLTNLERDNVVAAPASLDLEWVREPQLLPVGGPYQMQLINAADWYVNDRGSADDTFCVFAQDDAYGDAGIEGVDYAAEELGFEVETTTRYARGDTDFTAQVQELNSSGCEAVFAVATPAETAGLLKQAIGAGFAPTWIGQSPTWINVLPALVGNNDYLTQNYFVAAEGTEWGDTSVPGMEQMLADLEQYAPDQAPDYYFAFGYNQARAVTELLEKAVELGDLSREGIVTALEELGEVDFQGLTGTYTYGPPEDREPPRESTIFRVNVDKPNGLEVEKASFASEAAENFDIDEQLG